MSLENIPLTVEGLLGALYVLVAVMIVIVLYHVMFIVVDLRKIMRRFEDTTAQVESMILKPLSIIDEAFAWVLEHVNGEKKKSHKHSKHAKHDEEIDLEVTNV